MKVVTLLKKLQFLNTHKGLQYKKEIELLSQTWLQLLHHVPQGHQLPIIVVPLPDCFTIPHICSKEKKQYRKAVNYQVVSLTKDLFSLQTKSAEKNSKILKRIKHVRKSLEFERDESVDGPKMKKIKKTIAKPVVKCTQKPSTQGFSESDESDLDYSPLLENENKTAAKQIMKGV